MKWLTTITFPIGTQKGVEYSYKMLKWLIIYTRSINFGQLWGQYSRSVVFVSQVVFAFIYRILYCICHNSWKYTVWYACIRYIRYWNRQLIMHFRQLLSGNFTISSSLFTPIFSNLYSTSKRSSNWQLKNGSAADVLISILRTLGCCVPKTSDNSYHLFVRNRLPSTLFLWRQPCCRDKLSSQ